MLLEVALQQDYVDAMCSQKDNIGSTLALKLITAVMGAYHDLDDQISSKDTVLTTGFKFLQEVIKHLH